MEIGHPVGSLGSLKHPKLLPHFPMVMFYRMPACLPASCLAARRADVSEGADGSAVGSAV